MRGSHLALAQPGFAKRLRHEARGCGTRQEQLPRVLAPLWAGSAGVTWCHLVCISEQVRETRCQPAAAFGWLGSLVGATKASLPRFALLISRCILSFHAELHTGDWRRAGGWCDLQHIPPESAAPSHGQQRAALAGGKLGAPPATGDIQMFPCRGNRVLIWEQAVLPSAAWEGAQSAAPF